MFTQVTWLRHGGVVLLAMLLGVATDAMAQFRYQNATRHPARLGRKAFSIDWLDIPKVSLKQGRYLRKQSKREMIGFFFGIRGSANFHLKQYTQAIRDFGRAIALNKGLADAYYGRGCAYQELGQEKRAIKEYTRAIKLDSTMAAVYFNRGLAYTRTENYRGAIDDFVAFLNLVSFDPAYQDYISQVQSLLLQLKHALDGKTEHEPPRRAVVSEPERHPKQTT